MNNSKHKKIRKNKKPKALAAPMGQQQQNDQQLVESGGIFQQLANQVGEQRMQMESEWQLGQKKNSQKSKLKYCNLSHGYLFMLQINKCYKIVNSNGYAVDIGVIDGAVDLNGRLYSKLFMIKQQSSLIVSTIKNQLPQNNQKRQALQKQKKQLKNSKKEKLNKGQNLNKNVESIIHKIKQFQNSQIQEQPIDHIVQSYLADYESSQNVLIWSHSQNIQVFDLQGNIPWKKIDQLKYIEKGQITMVLGLKNTGKSVFCDYLLNKAENQNKQICILDTDIGRNRIFPGCVSFTHVSAKKQRKDMVIWIGQLTPLNNIEKYIKAVSQLYSFYKKNYFTSSLVVNTMGYLTGVGQLIIYEVFNILRPQNLLIMQSNNNQRDITIRNLVNCLKSGQYTKRLYFKLEGTSAKTSTKVQKYLNIFASKKPSPQRFQSLLTNNTLKSLDDLIELILRKKLIRTRNQLQIYQTVKNGETCRMADNDKQLTNLRLIIMGQFWESQLFLVEGFGFGWDNHVYYDPTKFKNEPKIGLISEGIDFQKSFYNIKQSRMIELQQQIGKRIPHVFPIFKTLGNKGVRNNSSKKANMSKE